MILLDSYFFYQLALNNKLIPANLQNPCLIPKAAKNETELEGSRKAHLRDGVSITKFLYWLKNHDSIEKENEISVANKLLSFRQLNELFHSVSFESISAIGKNAALPHYRTDKNSVLSWPIRDDTTAPLAYPKECKHIDYGLQYKIAIKRIFTLFFANIVADGA